MPTSKRWPFSCQRFPAVPAQPGVFDGVGVTFDQWTRKGSLKDFKTHDNNYLAGPIGDFLEVPEGGELKNDKPTDAKLPTRKIKTYGKQFTLSRQAFINDDTGGRWMIFSSLRKAKSGCRAYSGIYGPSSAVWALS